MTSARGEAKCTDVHFRYGRSEALSGFTATFARGMTGLLGPNGAGKSTLFSVLTTLARPQSGAVMVGGLDVASQSDQVRQIIGFLPQRFDLLGWQSVRRNVEYAAWARGLSPDESREATDATISKLGLTAYAGTQARSLSGGYRQRLGLACALAHDPEILLLDEPTVGIDPIARSELRRLLGELAETKTILATHLVEDVALAASQVVIINAGRCLFSGSTSELAELGRGRADQQSALEAGYEAVLLGVS